MQQINNNGGAWTTVSQKMYFNRTIIRKRLYLCGIKIVIIMAHFLVPKLEAYNKWKIDTIPARSMLSAAVRGEAGNRKKAVVNGVRADYFDRNH
jgi:hypothetical protein